MAFSRGKAYSKVKVKIFATPTQGRLIPGSSRIFTQNIVYREVLDLDTQTAHCADLETIWEEMDPEEFDFDTAQVASQNIDDDMVWSDVDLEGLELEGEESPAM